MTDSERTHRRQLQRQRRDGEGYVKVTVALVLDAEQGLATVAQDLGLDERMIHRYASASAQLGAACYLAHE